MPVARSAPSAMAQPQSYAELVALAGEKRDLLVKHALEASLTPISFAEGRIEVALVDGADPAIIQTLSSRLKVWTGRNWLIMVSSAPPQAPTLRDQRRAREEDVKARAHEDPLVQAILDAFPGAKVSGVRLREEEPPAPPPPSARWKWRRCADCSTGCGFRKTKTTAAAGKKIFTCSSGNTTAAAAPIS